MDDLTITREIALPLYRFAGAQMDQEQLLHKEIKGLVSEADERLHRNPDFYNEVKKALVLLKKLCLAYSSPTSFWKVMLLSYL